MKVLLANANGADVYWGGAERYVRDLRTGLEERGNEVHVLSAFPPRDDDSQHLHVLHDTDWRDDRRRRHRNHLEDWVARVDKRMLELLEGIGPDLIHTNNLPGISTGIWECARRLRIPVVHTLHDYHLLCPRTSLTRADNTPCRPSPMLCGLRTHRLSRWAPGVTSVIGVSTHVLARHQAFFRWGTARTVIRPPLVPIAVARTEPGPELRTLGFLGALTVSKGLQLVLGVAPALRELGITIRIAGGGPLESETQANKAVDYVGRLARSQVADFIRGCDAGLVPSLWEEPGPFVVREWLGAGRPVIATAIGGLIEAAEIGGVALFDGSPEGLRAETARLSNLQAWQALCARVPRVEDMGDQARWVSEHDATYQQALAISGRRSRS
jgi:glycosyltransferase involved in cell wall biosynthesis